MAPSRVSAWARVIAPKGLRDFILQLGLLGSFSVLYALSGIYGRDEASTAIANARTVLRVERTLGIDWEHGVQRWALGGPHLLIEIANRTYFTCQFVVSILFLLWVYARRNAQFALVRNAILAANLVSLVTLAVFPTAPPRMVPGSSFVDTLDANGVNLHSRLVDALNNPYSAVPSLHASYAIVLGVAGAALTRRWWTRAFWALYPGLVVYSVLATGNHWVLDVVTGAAALLATPLVGWVAVRLDRRRGQCCPPALAEQSAHKGLA